MSQKSEKKPSTRKSSEFKRSATARYKAVQSFINPKKGHYKRETIQKRKREYYTTGKGSEGLLVRIPRCGKHIRQIRGNVSESFGTLIGDDNEKTKKVVFKSFTQTAVAGLDASANELLETAYKIADINGAKKLAGEEIRLQKKHLEGARMLIQQLRSQ